MGKPSTEQWIKDGARLFTTLLAATNHGSDGDRLQRLNDLADAHNMQAWTSDDFLSVLGAGLGMCNALIDVALPAAGIDREAFINAMAMEFAQ